MEHWSSTWAGSSTGKLTVVVDGDPLADGHFLLLQEVVRATRAGFHVVVLGSGPSQAHYEAVTRKMGVDLSRQGFTFVPIIPSVDAPSISAPSSTTIKETESGAGLRVLAIQSSQASTAPSSNSHVGLLQSRVLPSVLHAMPNVQGQGTFLVVDDLSVVEGLYGTTEALTLLRTCKALMAKNGDQCDVDHRDQVALLVRCHGDILNSIPSMSTVQLLPYLLRTADVLIEVRPLSSGYSRDVHGLVSVRSNSLVSSPEVLTFKVQEGGARFSRLSTRTPTSVVAGEA